MNRCLDGIFWFVVARSTNIDEACSFRSSESNATCIVDSVIAMIHSGNSQMEYHLNIDGDESRKDKCRYNQVMKWILYNYNIIL